MRLGGFGGLGPIFERRAIPTVRRRIEPKMPATFPEEPLGVTRKHPRDGITQMSTTCASTPNSGAPRGDTISDDH